MTATLILLTQRRKPLPPANRPRKCAPNRAAGWENDSWEPDAIGWWGREP